MRRARALLALEMASAMVCRGLLIAVHHTGSIEIGAVVRIVTVAVVGASALALGRDNGAPLSILSLIAAFAAETAQLLHRMRHIDRGTPRLCER